VSARSKLHQVLSEHYADAEHTECVPCRLINEYKAEVLWGASNMVQDLKGNRMDPSVRFLRELAVEAQRRAEGVEE
jgi:hypothetical protein